MGGEKGKRRRCGGKTLLESQLSSNTIRSTRKGAVSLSGKCDWGVGGWGWMALSFAGGREGTRY